MDNWLIPWAAGFFDGEGHIASHIDKRDGRVAVQMIVVQCGTIDTPPDTLLRFRDAVGGIGKIKLRHAGRAGKTRDWRPSWQWYATTTADIRTAASLLLPYLGDAKVDQVAAALSRRTEYEGLLVERRMFCHAGHPIDRSGSRGSRSRCWDCHNRQIRDRRRERYHTDPEYRLRRLRKGKVAVAS